MPENLSIGDISLLATMAIGAIVGLFRGLSGGLGTICGIGAAIAAGWFLLDPISAFIAARGWIAGELGQRAATIVADGVIGLLTFGIVRKLIERFVRCLVPRSLDTLLGAVVGGAAGFAIWRAGRWALEFYLQGGDAVLQGTVAT